jgi:hypothetical protein
MAPSSHHIRAVYKSELSETRLEPMVALRISLPGDIARAASPEGLPAPDALEQILCEHMQALRVARIDAARERLAQAPVPPMTAEEIQAEIDAYRAEQRLAAGY